MRYNMAFLTGEVSGSVTAKQLPAIKYEMLNIKAALSNTGNVYVGNSSSTIIASGVTNTNTGFELDAGDNIWFPYPGNLNELYIICDNATDDIIYIVLQ